MKRALAVVALVVAVGGVVGALTFPTDALVRAALARVPLPAGVQLEFSRARLRPTGLRFDDVRIVQPDGRVSFEAAWFRLRPSLRGLWRDRTGRPWTIATEACQGRIDATIDGTPHGTPIAARLEHVELGACLPWVFPRVDAYGRVDGRVDLEIRTDGPHAGSGALELRGAAWTPGGALDDTVLRADQGALEWHTADNRVELTRLEASSRDFALTGAGFVRLHQALDDAVLDLRIAITPGPTMPPLLGRYVDAAAGATAVSGGTRTFRVQGRLNDPRVTPVAAGATGP